MSFFMSSMLLDGLMSSPPVSKQTPLPTSVSFVCTDQRHGVRTRRSSSSTGYPNAPITNASPSGTSTKPSLASVCTNSSISAATDA